jgi:hypothetical protein
MRTWAIACAVFVLLLLVIAGIEYRLAHPTVPPGLQRFECLAPAPEAEAWNDQFARMGGRTTRYPNAEWTGSAFTVPDVTQGRDLSKYDKLELRDSEHLHPWERQLSNALAQARTFLWEHWQGRKRGYLMLTLSSVDHTGTAHIFVEPNDSGRWRVYWRQLDRRGLTDEPTAYSILWVIPNEGDKPGAALPNDQVPDPFKDQLEFRDLCGEFSGSL